MSNNCNSQFGCVDVQRRNCINCREQMVGNCQSQYCLFCEITIRNGDVE